MRYQILFASLLLTVIFCNSPVGFCGPKTPIKHESNLPGGIQEIKIYPFEVANDGSESSSQIAGEINNIVGDGQISNGIVILNPSVENLSSTQAKLIIDISNQVPNKKNIADASALVRYFPELFSKQFFGMSVILTEITLVGGAKYFEIAYASQGISEAVALVTAGVFGTTLGFMDWRAKKIVNFIHETDGIVKFFLKKVEKNVSRPGVKKRIHSFFESMGFKTVWGLTKNAYINIRLLAYFELILYGVTHPHDLESWDAIKTIPLKELMADATKWGLLATAVDYPMTKVILNYEKELAAIAGENPREQRIAKNLTSFTKSSAFVGRTVLLLTAISAHAANVPFLEYAAEGTLGVMAGWSTVKWISNSICSRKLH